MAKSICMDHKKNIKVHRFVQVIRLIRGVSFV
jgi:hypothetical protein